MESLIGHLSDVVIQLRVGPVLLQRPLAGWVDLDLEHDLAAGVLEAQLEPADPREAAADLEAHQSSHSIFVAPPWPWTASTDSMPRWWNTTEVGNSLSHCRATTPLENSMPSATTPVPDTPVTSVSRRSWKRRNISDLRGGRRCGHARRCW